MKLEQVEQLLEGELTEFAEGYVRENYCEQEQVMDSIDYLLEKEYDQRDLRDNIQIIFRPVENLKDTYHFWTQLLPESRVKERPDLLPFHRDKLEQRLDRLLDKGTTRAKIKRQPGTLFFRCKVVDQRWQRLVQQGLSEDKIASRLELLKLKPETIDDHYAQLSNLGLSRDKINAHPQLLAWKPKTVRQDYNNLRRYLSAETIGNMPQLLINSQETIDANATYLREIGIDYETKPILFGTKPSTKRKKVSWISQNIFEGDYELTKDFVQQHPDYLVWGVSHLEEEEQSIRRQALKEDLLDYDALIKDDARQDYLA